MYQSPAVKRTPAEEEEYLARDKMAGSGNHQLPPYPRSPSMGRSYHNYSPTNGSHPQPSYGNYGSRPSSSAAMHAPPPVNQSPRLGQPQSPSNGLAHINRPAYQSRETASSTYYDPTSEHRERDSTWTASSYAGRSPGQVCRIKFYVSPIFCELTRQLRSLASPCPTVTTVTKKA